VSKNDMETSETQGLIAGAKPLEKLVEADAGGKRRRAKKAAKAAKAAKVAEPPATAAPALKRERGQWSIPVQLTELELLWRGKRLGDITLSLGSETLKIARAKDAAKIAIKAAEAAIESLNEEALPLAQQLDSGTEERFVDCLRATIDGEMVYTDPVTGIELHRHALAKGEQLGCWGGAPPDKPPPAAEPTLDELLGAARSLGESVLLADSAPSIDPPDSRWHRFRKQDTTFMARWFSGLYDSSGIMRFAWSHYFRDPRFSSVNIVWIFLRGSDPDAGYCTDDRPRQRWGCYRGEYRFAYVHSNIDTDSNVNDNTDLDPSSSNDNPYPYIDPHQHSDTDNHAVSEPNSSVGDCGCW